MGDAAKGTWGDADAPWACLPPRGQAGRMSVKLGNRPRARAASDERGCVPVGGCLGAQGPWDLLHRVGSASCPERHGHRAQEGTRDCSPEFGSMTHSLSCDSGHMDPLLGLSFII